jgi:toxin ParE1/3/4
VARVELAPAIGQDFDRILEHLQQHDVAAAADRIADIVRAIDVLKHNPLIGRPTSTGSSELIIGRRAGGYVALSRYIEPVDTVFVLAIHGQREAGCGRD